MPSAISNLQPLSRDADAAAPRPVREPRFERALALQGAAARSSVLVAPQRTRLDGAQAAQALGRAWQSVFGAPASQSTLAVLTAQWAHETGNGASMFNYNFAGIKGSSPEGLSVAQRTREGSGAAEHVITDRFRAYSSADAGATDYLRLLRDRFPEAVQAAKNSDPTGFVRALKQRGYFTGDEAQYTRSVNALAAQGLTRGFETLRSEPGELLARAEPVGPGAPRLQAAIPESASLDASGAYIDALRLGDEISRAALRIVAASGRKET